MLFRYPMSLEEVKQAILKKIEKDGYKPLRILIDGPIMQVYAFKYKDSTITIDTDKPDMVLIAKIKKDPLKYIDFKGGKINLCDYVPEFRDNKHYWNQRYYNKYNQRLFSPVAPDKNLDKEKGEFILNQVLKEVIKNQDIQENNDDNGDNNDNNN